MNKLYVVLISSLLLACCGCSKSVQFKADAIQDRAVIPDLDAQTVTTLISDSGITRYRISADEWQIYDKAEIPYWEFKRGIYLEKFNENLEVEASLRSDYAYFNKNEERWRLDGNVHAINEKGEQFDTPQLYWDQRTETIYSDSSIVITRQSSTIMGVGFVSNQSMSQYTIKQPSGFFPIEE